MIDGLKDWARAIKRDVHAIYLASRDPRVPWYAKALAAAVAGYALSPIDLIPDFIPVLGYLDDLIIVPLGIWLAVSLIPADVMSHYRRRWWGERMTSQQDRSYYDCRCMDFERCGGGVGCACLI